jgi:hypothetical protein
LSDTHAIAAWQDDPGEPGESRTPVERAAVDLASEPLPLAIDGAAPPPAAYQPGTPEFRYYAAAEAARRAADFWAQILPSTITWNPAVGAVLTLFLDAGDDLNAYYDREGLKFFQHRIGAQTFYSGESPDVVCHELGHAVVDSVRPQLWGAAALEPPAFHEAAADISAILSALQLSDVRDAVLEETGGLLTHSSRLSRVAEQLGYALRLVRPDAVDADCLRNAVNSLFYEDPMQLPPTAPATSLSSEPHSLSRVFTGAFFQGLAGMYAAADQSLAPNERLHQVSSQAGRLLIAAVIATPVVPSYFSQVAAHILAAEEAQTGGQYRQAFAAGFVQHGILAPAAVNQTRGQRFGLAAAVIAGEDQIDAAEELPALSLGDEFGLGREIVAQAASQPKRFAVAAASSVGGEAATQSHDRVATAFVEDLIRRGRIDFGETLSSHPLAAPERTKSHTFIEQDGALLLQRNHFDCFPER